MSHIGLCTPKSSEIPEYPKNPGSDKRSDYFILAKNWNGVGNEKPNEESELKKRS